MPHHRYVRATDLTAEFGFTDRHWIKQAAAGRVPGAFQPFGPHSTWVFDIEAVRAWWAEVGIRPPPDTDVPPVRLSAPSPDRQTADPARPQQTARRPAAGGSEAPFNEMTRTPMPTTLPPARIVPWPNLVRVMWLWARITGLNARMKWLPATHRQQLACAVRWLAYSEEMFRLLGMPEPKHIGEMRAVFMRRLPDDSTILNPSGYESPNRTATPSTGLLTRPESGQLFIREKQLLKNDWDAN